MLPESQWIRSNEATLKFRLDTPPVTILYVVANSTGGKSQAPGISGSHDFLSKSSQF